VLNLVAKVHAEMRIQAQDSFEILLIVDGSPDDTWEHVQQVCNQYTNVRGLKLSRNFGQHAALLAGFNHASGNIIVTLDDDLQQDPADISKLLSSLGSGYELVYGLNTLEEHSWARNFFSRAFKWFAKTLLGVHDASKLSAFRAFNRRILDGLDVEAIASVPVDVFLYWTTKSVGFVYIEMRKRESGSSGYTIRKLFSHALDSVTGYSLRPLRLITLLGVVASLFGLFLIVRTIEQYLSGEIEVLGYSTVLIAVSFFASVQLLCIGIIGEYLGKIHASSIGKPTYIISDKC
jgi:undecaprenyl-phosphate 4-deoxy-4-formamido-L-arabinose transferase